MASPSRKKSMKSSIAKADAASWHCAMVLVTLILLGNLKENSLTATEEAEAVRGTQFLARPCDEFYVVGEGETLHTISDKCSDPYIVENNPHIHDPDDVFPGIVIKVTPSISRI
ncbi:Monofunctional biosynthetic peptidoglycan transglycosylase [Actinidia chinensis var. chinensis]|uniref:Monofunctional biosynthetic peptidoglycan transglycosylase n=1 Tax=Actinidia chinensis var. chinensis TaxID=1590841 RepID=A0A2R6RWD4_ACTCC|nr:Monofunctional biosynthetic peptidoglycan transglycosylase [Actinidia chinensis var. chinensis]